MDALEVIELKSGTKVKAVNLLDVAFQKHVCEGAALRTNRCYVMHADPGNVRSGDIVAAEFCHEQISDCISMQDLPTNATIRILGYYGVTGQFENSAGKTVQNTLKTQ